jgi:hypothetical protein
MALKQRQGFTIAEKAALRARKRECQSLTQKELAIWFEARFGKAIKQVSISEILLARYQHLDIEEAGDLQKKKQRREAYTDLRRAFFK